MDHRATIIASCWLAVAVISSVYMWLFADKIGDVLFGVFFPVGLLVFIAFIVTVIVASKPMQNEPMSHPPPPSYDVAATQTISTEKFCKHCGAELAPNSLYCPHCGQKIQ